MGVGYVRLEIQAAIWLVLRLWASRWATGPLLPTPLPVTDGSATDSLREWPPGRDWCSIRRASFLTLWIAAPGAGRVTRHGQRAPIVAGE